MRYMNVLHVNTSDNFGGAARAAYRLHQALLFEGISSELLVHTKTRDDYNVHGPQTKFQSAAVKVRKNLDNLPLKRYKKRSKSYFSPGWLPCSRIPDQINALNPDLVHLHWIGEGMMSIKDLGKIKAPIVWTLHDNWPFTGGCHVMWQCARYQEKCGACPQLGQLTDHDLSRSGHLRKQKTYSKISRIRIVGPSQWITACAKKSSLMDTYTIHCIPNPINTQTYAPFDKKQARNLLQLPSDKKLIAFGAVRATDDINKGYKELSEALKYVPDSYELVVFGSSKPKNVQGFEQRSHYLGHVHDDVSLRLLYNAADVMVVPSLQESFGQTASEAMACGTPVVAFNATGLVDIIDHQENGYLAKPYSINSLAEGINWILESDQAAKLQQNAREKVLQTFDSQIVAQKYIEVYKELISG